MNRIQPGTLIRTTAAEINRISTKLENARGGKYRPTPLPYGRGRVLGIHIEPPVSSGALTYTVLWGSGPIGGIESYILNDGPIDPRVSIETYLGEDDQPIYPGYAVTRFTIPTTTGALYRTFLKAEAVIQGRKVFDPRNGLYAHSSNPALILNDIVTNSTYGFGRPQIKNIVDAANYCDQLYNGRPRCECGISFTDQLTEREIISLLTAYAECAWAYDGDTIALYPDEPIITAPPKIESKDVKDLSFDLKAREYSDTPTVVEADFTTETSSGSWGVGTARSERLDAIATVVSRLDLKGVLNSDIALRYATRRLFRLSVPGQLAWEAFDDAVGLSIGEVVDLDHITGYSPRVRVTDLRMTSPGRYRVDAESYSLRQFMDQQFDHEPSLAFVGLIIPYMGDDTPYGWSEYNAANGYCLRGASTVGGTGGGGTLSGTLTSSSDDMHPEGDLPTYLGPADLAGTLRPIFAPISVDTTHSHSMSVSEFTPKVHSLGVRLIKKADEDGLIPIDALLLGASELANSALEKLYRYNSRLLAAASTFGASEYTGDQSVDCVTSAYSINHRHYDEVPNETSGSASSGHIEAGAHEHGSATLTVRVDPARITVGLYRARSITRIVKGCIGFVESATSLPSGWKVADGTNGTINAISKFFEIAETPGVSTGADAVRFTGTLSPVGHGHEGDALFNGAVDHIHSSVTHEHEVNDSLPWIPSYFGLIPIQYLPE